MIPTYPPGEIAKLVKLQEEENAIRRSMTPEERAERAKEQLRGMPGQRYLFEDSEAGGSVQPC